MTAHGQPDQPRSARYILKDYVSVSEPCCLLLLKNWVFLHCVTLESSHLLSYKGDIFSLKLSYNWIYILNPGELVASYKSVK